MFVPSVSNFFLRMGSWSRGIRKTALAGLGFLVGFNYLVHFQDCTGFWEAGIAFVQIFYVHILFSDAGPDTQAGVGARSAQKLQSRFSSPWDSARCSVGFPVGLGMTCVPFPEQSCPFFTIPPPSFPLASFTVPCLSLLENLFSTCLHDHILCLSDQKITKSTPPCASTDITDRCHKSVWLIYLFKDYWFSPSLHEPEGGIWLLACKFASLPSSLPWSAAVNPFLYIFINVNT